MYDYRVVLKRYESTRSVKLPLELYGTDEQVALVALVLLEANIAPLQDAPVADTTPRAMNRSRRLLSPELNLRHTDVVSRCVCCFFRYCRHDTLYTICITYICTVQYYCALPLLVSISSTWYTFWRVGTI